MYNYAISCMHSHALDTFIREASALPEKPIVSADNMMLFMKFRSAICEMNFVMAQLITVYQLIELLDKKEFKYIVGNIHRIINSLVKHRNFLGLVRDAVSRKSVDPAVKAACSYEINRADQRCAYIRASALEENIRLTPINEYIEIVGEKSLLSPLKEIASSKEAMKDLQCNDKLSAFAKHIFDTVTEAGKENLYKQRLFSYVEKRDKEVKAYKDEKRAEKNKQLADIAYAGMNKFHDLLSNAFYCRSGCEEIGISSSNALHAMSSLENRYIILRCDLSPAGRYRFRYVSKNGSAISQFSQAPKFQTHEEAVFLVSRLTKLDQNQGKCFSIYQIGN